MGNPEQTRWAYLAHSEIANLNIIRKVYIFSDQKQLAYSLIMETTVPHSHLFSAFDTIYFNNNNIHKNLLMAVEGSLKIREVAKFESERLKTYKDMAPQSPLKCLQAL